jgi:hypothetical protein
VPCGLKCYDWSGRGAARGTCMVAPLSLSDSRNGRLVPPAGPPAPLFRHNTRVELLLAQQHGLSCCEVGYSLTFFTELSFCLRNCTSSLSDRAHPHVSFNKLSFSTHACVDYSSLQWLPVRWCWSPYSEGDRRRRRRRYARSPVLDRANAKM